MRSQVGRSSARRSILTAVLALGVPLFALGAGCSDDGGSQNGSQGATDAGGDGGGDGASGGETPRHEDYFISYRLDDETTPEGPELKLYSTADGSTTTVSPDSADCTRCGLSRDMEQFVEIISSGQSEFNVLVTEVGEDKKATGSSSTLVENVEDAELVGNHVTYARSTGEDTRTLFYKPLAGGAETQIAELDADAADADWEVAPDQNIALVFDPESAGQSMNVEVRRLDGNETGSYTLGGTNFTRQSGSYYDGDFISGISPNGRLAAFAVGSPKGRAGGPNDYGRCTRNDSGDPWSSDECDGDVLRKCGLESRCTRLEVTVYLIDVENRVNLGRQCSGQEENPCGPIHRCYAPSEAQQDEARCIPARAVLGVPETPQGPERSTGGCETVQSDDSIDFTGVRGPLTFDDTGAFGNAYLVGRRDRGCLEKSGGGSYETGGSQIVKIDPTGIEPDQKSYQMIEGLPADRSFKQNNCWDPDAGESGGLDLEDCPVYVGSARISPGGDELAYTATNPNTQSPRQANSLFHLWHILRDGSGRTFTGDKNTFSTNVVSGIRVHPGPSGTDGSTGK